MCRGGRWCAASEAENLITLRPACTDRYITRVTLAEDLSRLNGVAGRGYVFASYTRYASYGRYLCRDDKFNRRLKMRLEIRETRFLAHTAFFPPYREIYILYDSLSQRAPLLSPRLVRVHRHASISHRFSSPQIPLARNLYFPEIHRIKYFPGYD